MTNTNDHSTAGTGALLARLRGLVPGRKIGPVQAMAVAEAQAELLRMAMHLPSLRLPEDLLADEPDLRVRRSATAPAAGTHRFDRRTRQWVITVRAYQPETRQRLALLRQTKHVLDEPELDVLYHPAATIRHAQREQAATHFALCVLMNRHAVELIIAAHTTTVEDIATVFGVDPDTAERRLAELDLIDDHGRIRLDVHSLPIPLDETEGATP